MLSLLATLALQGPADAPPGTVLVPGGRTRIGIDMKELERLLEDDAAAQNFAGVLSGETPHQDLDVASFWMMTTEVTQEQYAVFVRAKDALPLEPWCEAAMRAASEEFNREEQRLANEARASDKPPLTRRTFDPHAWWLANGRAAAWELPEGDRGRPAVFVDFDSARAYARFAGLRLPTEFEFQRAVRGDTGQVFPWGNDWDNEKYAATNLLKKKGNTWPAGSFPAGRTKLGLCDLAGNAWEWTSSPYTPYPGYEQRVFEFGYGSQKRKVNAIADWNESQRVVVGGSFQTSSLMCRATVRRGTDKSQTAGALGFRCAGSVRPGVDMAKSVLDDDLDVQLRPRTSDGPVEYAPGASVCADGWRTSAGVPAASWTPPESYAVIDGYAYVSFTPVRQIPAADIAQFERKSAQEEPIQLGFLTTNVRLLEPALDPGTYLVSYRARGARRTTDAKPASSGDRLAIEDALQLDVQFDHVILSDLRQDPRVALRHRVEYVTEREGVAKSTPHAPPDGATDTSRQRNVRIEACIPCRTTKRGFLLAVDLTIEAPREDVKWRR